MPEVYFELLGDDFDVNAALAGSPLREFARVQPKGETSGLQIWVGGDAAASLEDQIASALEFLGNDPDELLRLRCFSGVEQGRLRFGELWPEGMAVHFQRFPSDLLLACGKLRLDIVLSQYLIEQTANHKSASA